MGLIHNYRNPLNLIRYRAEKLFITVRDFDEMDGFPHLAQQCHVTDRSLSSKSLHVAPGDGPLDLAA
jgi:hypothetical protein